MKKKQIIMFASVGLIVLGVYLFYKQGKAEAVSPEQSDSEENQEESAKADWNKVLKRGSEGIEVEILQKALKQLDVDRDFGEKTEARLKSVTGVTQTSLNKYNEFFKK
jgi:hypothetical protein